MKRLVVLIGLVSSACAHVPAQVETSAIIVGSTTQSRDELRRVIRAALGTDQIVIADDALTNSSTLFIERTQRDGRSLERPEKFSLISAGHRCVLIHERTARRYELPLTRCQAR